MDDNNIYEKESREELVDDAEISPEEAGFMEGYDEAGERTEEEKGTREEEE